MIKKSLLILSALIILIALLYLLYKPAQNIKIVNIENGWARNSINTVIFRHNSITSYKTYQYVAFYDDSANIILAKRQFASTEWEIYKTQYNGNVNDAHNSISIIFDGDGYLHMSWDHHGNPLNYCRSKFSGRLELTDKMTMTDSVEQNVTYPEFDLLLLGNLVFLYRDGTSGKGNLAMNFYDIQSKTWTKLHNNLIDGEGQRNAYWQTTVSEDGTIHLSWVWRESWDVATNHDICYAKSTNEGKSWLNSRGEKYVLPITAETAEYAIRIPQGNELINQTSMYTDSGDHPYIATYWKPEGSQIPQFHLVYYDGTRWNSKQISNRKTAFSLSGGGTKRIPISRPLILMDKNDTVYIIYRDAERGNLVSVAKCDDLENNIWTTSDLTSFPVGQWEPTYDSELWKSENKLNLFVQNVGQGDSEMLDDVQPQMISVLEYENQNWIDRLVQVFKSIFN